MLEFAGEMTTILMQQNWYFLICPKNSYFISSDHPFGMIKSKNVPEYLGVGIINSEKTFPLTSKICLFIGEYGAREAFLPIDEEMTLNINMRTAACSKDRLFSCDMDFLKNTIETIRKVNETK